MSRQSISLTVQHPFLDTMVVIELDLNNITDIRCHIHSTNGDCTELANKMSKVVQVCVSIPLLLRSLIKAWECENAIGLQRALENGNFNIKLGPNDPGGKKPPFDNDGTVKSEHANEYNSSSNEHDANANNNGNRAKFPSQTAAHVAAATNANEAENGNHAKAFNENSMFEGDDVNFMHVKNGDNGSMASGGNNANTSNATNNINVTANVTGIVNVAAVSSAPMDVTYGVNEKIGKRRRTEDFWKSPKSEYTSTVDVIAEQQSTNQTSSDSNSLGAPTTSSMMLMSDDGVARTIIPTTTASSSGTSTPVSASASVTADSKLKETAAVSVNVAKLDLASIKSSSYSQNCDKTANKGEPLDAGESVKKRIKRKEEKTSDTIDGRSSISPSVSITPIPSSSSSSASSSSLSSVLTCLERRSGIEIIPISSAPAQNIKSSITITPISSSSKSSGGSSNSDKRSMSSSSSSSSSNHSSSSSASKKFDDRQKMEKKKKRKRDEAPMGPPEKMPFKQDPLSRPVTVSIKTTDGSPVSPSGLLRKFSTSPVPSSSNKISLSAASNRVSPKHSPHHHGLGMTSGSSHASPKHQTLPSPKSSQYGTSSPKHLSAGSSSSSGKPSMSALKSAAISPNSKSSSASSSSSSSNSASTGDRVKSSSSSSSSARERDKDRDRERGDRDRDRSLKYSSGSNSPKLKTSSVKLKQIDLSTEFLPAELLLDTQAGGQDLSKLVASGQATKNRKGSLSAVIDKLKSAHSVNEDSPPSTPTLASAQIPDLTITPATNSNAPTAMNKDKSSLSISATGSASSSSSTTPAAIGSALKNSSEYMVKHSLDGMRITINKTRTKDASPSSKHGYSSTSGSSSGSNSPKTHTGLKPGVNSGPASKKPQSTPSFHSLGGSSNALSSSISVTPSSSSGSKSSSSSTKSMISKSSSSGSLSSSSKALANSSGSGTNSGSSGAGGSGIQKNSSSSHADSHKKDKNRGASSSSRSNSGMFFIALAQT